MPMTPVPAVTLTPVAHFPESSTLPRAGLRPAGLAGQENS